VIVLTKDADVSRVVRAFQSGVVVDFFEKHLLHVEDLVLAIQRAQAIDATQCSRHRAVEARFERVSMLEEALRIQPHTPLKCPASRVISIPMANQRR
jgi:FixJ family two-component response regulator